MVVRDRKSISRVPHCSQCPAVGLSALHHPADSSPPPFICIRDAIIDARSPCSPSPLLCAFKNVLVGCSAPIRPMRGLRGRFLLSSKFRGRKRRRSVARSTCRRCRCRRRRVGFFSLSLPHTLHSPLLFWTFPFVGQLEASDFRRKEKGRSR